MKYFKKLGIYKASNVEFNPQDVTAYSYKHWLFVTKIGNAVVFNDFNYSNTTAKHQHKVKYLMIQLGIKIDYYIESPNGLNNLYSAQQHYENMIETLKQEIAKPRSHKAKNKERADLIASHNVTLRIIKALNK